MEVGWVGMIEVEKGNVLYCIYLLGFMRGRGGGVERVSTEVQCIYQISRI